MKRVVSILIVFSMGVLYPACTQSDSSPAGRYPGLEQRGDLYYESGSDQPYTGTIKYAAEEGAEYKESRYSFRGGVLRSSVSIYPGGHLYAEANFDIDGQMKNLAYFYPSGQIRSEFTEGLMKEWYENGQLKSETHFSGPGVLDGKVLTWYPDGTLKGYENYVQDNLDGSKALYDTDGQLIIKQRYEEGRLVDSDTLQPLKMP